MSIDCAPSREFGRDTAVRELLKPIAPLLGIEGATEVVVNRPFEAIYEQGAHWHACALPDLSFGHLMSLVRAVATYCHQDVGPDSPIVSALLPDGQRIQIMVPPVVPTDTISLSIRLPCDTLKTLTAYQAEGMFDRFSWPCADRIIARRHELDDGAQALVDALCKKDLIAFFERAILDRNNIAVVGDTGSGKTTLMKTLCQIIPAHERLVTIEDVRELVLPQHNNLVRLLYSKGDHGPSAITPADLIAASMRMRPDRVLLAELRGAEAFDYLKLLATGHSGSMTSFHAESCALAFERYVLMAKEHADATIFDADGLKRLVRLTIDVVVHVRAEVIKGDDSHLVKRRFVSAIHYDPAAKLQAQSDGHVIQTDVA